MKKQILLLIIVSATFFSACNKKKVAELEKQLSLKEQEVALYENQIGHLQMTNKSLLDRMEDLSIISKSGAESIQQSMENLSQQYDFIQDLTTKVHSKDSLNLALVMNLKRSLIDINDDDVQVEVRGGKVHVSISDQLLFKSGSANINSRAADVMSKIATVINDHDQLDVMVEGHTDNVPMSNSCIADNWDLSVKRATSVVRMLTNDYYVAPERLIAAGRSEFMPKAGNETTDGRSINRRTEIVIMPKLDQFFKLLETPELKQ